MVVIQIARCKGSDGLIIQGVGRGGAGFYDIALVKLEFDFTGYILLCLLYKSLNSLS